MGGGIFGHLAHTDAAKSVPVTDTLVTAGIACIIKFLYPRFTLGNRNSDYTRTRFPGLDLSSSALPLLLCVGDNPRDGSKIKR